MPARENPMIPLHHLPTQPTGISYPERNSIDGLSSPVEPTHAARMNEMLNRPATPPPFPEALPPRPNKQGLNKWMLASVALLIALLGSVIPLGVLLGVAKAKVNKHPANTGMLAADVAAATTMMMTHTALTTATQMHNITATQTQVETTTQLQPTTVTSVRRSVFHLSATSLPRSRLLQPELASTPLSQTRNAMPQTSHRC